MALCRARRLHYGSRVQPPSHEQQPPSDSWGTPSPYGQQPGYGPPPGPGQQYGQYGQQPGYGYQQGYGPPAVPNDGGATTAMVMGILGLTLCAFLAPVGLFMGLSARRRIDASGGTLGGRNMAVAGFVMGAIGTGLLALLAVFVIIGITGAILENA